MSKTQPSSGQNTGIDEKKKSARDWMLVLQKYRTPDIIRSFYEIAVSLIPFVALWIAAYQSLKVSYLLSLVFCLIASCFLVRLFIIQHDCGHGAFFKSKSMNNWVGRFIGVLTLTPYTLWRQAHLIHHASSGNLDKRGVGDINTLTVDEYLARSPKGRLSYRLYRHPLVLFGIGPIFIFMLHYRLPIGFMKSGLKYWVSSLGTSLSMLVGASVLIYFIGFKAFAMIYFPVAIVAAVLGVWMFYIQHQFENTVWEKGDDWEMQDAALFGSSYYDLPWFLPWLTGYIGIHHVHHLNSRIPFYRLKKVLRDHAALANMKRITLWESFKCVKLQLWCEQKKKLVSFKEAIAGAKA